MHPGSSLKLLFAAALYLASVPLPAAAQSMAARGELIAGRYSGTAFVSTTLVNETVGALPFYNSQYFGASTVIGNIEAGHIWSGHEVFDRTGFGLGPAVTREVTGSGALGETDFHATMVGHVLAGAGYIDGESGPAFSYSGIGMAPYAELWSGAIATEFSSESIGSFDVTTESMLAPYRAFFRGIDGRKADVINSSWGGTYEPGTSVEMVTIDALARENASVAFVVAAGNSGTSTVSAPGSNDNAITVGALGGPEFLTPSEFSSRGWTGFYNPETGWTTPEARVGVDLAAPGETLFLAAYLGPTGGLQSLAEIVQSPSPTDLYFLNQDGTSFAAPTVAGGIALLKDAANAPQFGISPEGFDTRVIKSALMAGSRRTEGWDNGQADADGVLRTTQALDQATGAGALDLMGTAEVYLLAATRDVSETGGGSIAADGWDYGVVSLGQSNDYLFASAFTGDIELTIALNWFSGAMIDEQTDLGAGLSFANLDLALWLVTDGVFVAKIAESATIFNNTEFLRVNLPEDGTYGLRITFLGLVYDVTDSVTEETYGLAWRSQPQAVPEPSGLLLLAVPAGWLIIRRLTRRTSGSISTEMQNSAIPS